MFAGVPVAERILRLTNLRYDPVNNPPLTCASNALFCFPHSTSSLISELHPYDIAALALFRTRAPLSRMALSPYPDGPYLFVQIMKIVHELVRVVDILSMHLPVKLLAPLIYQQRSVYARIPQALQSTFFIRGCNEMFCTVQSACRIITPKQEAPCRFPSSHRQHAQA